MADHYFNIKSRGKLLNFRTDLYAFSYESWDFLTGQKLCHSQEKDTGTVSLQYAHEYD